MVNIEDIAQEAVKHGLVQHIHGLRFRLEHSNWSSIRDGDHFVRLGAAINNAEDILQEMRETLLELQKIAPDNK